MINRTYNPQEPLDLKSDLAIGVKVNGCFNCFVQGVLEEAHNALTAVTKSLDPGQQMTIVPDIRQAVRFAAADLKEEGDLLPGFCLPKVRPLLLH